MPEPLTCHLCGRAIPMHAYYVVKIEVFADPTMPSLTHPDPREPDFGQGYANLVAELNQYSTEELQDMVHRRFEYRLCRPCQLRFIANPLGLPRVEKPGEN
jgi:hypothetical protein